MTNAGRPGLSPQLRGALLVTGPLDAAINWVINTGIAWYFLRHAGPLPIWGLPSVYGFFGPLVVCVLVCTVLSGYRNGVLWSWTPPRNWRSWLAPGLGWGLASAVLGSGGCFAALAVCDSIRDGQPLAARTVVFADGVVAAALGYCGQVLGVWAAVRRSSSM